MLARNVYRSFSVVRAIPRFTSYFAGYHTSPRALRASGVEQTSHSESVVDYQLPAFADIQRHSGWCVNGKEPLTQENLNALLANKLSYIGVPNFLSADECSRLVDVITTHKIVSIE